MKNWLIEKLGGVPKQTYMATVDSYDGMLAMYTNQLEKLEQENAGMKAEKAEMEKAAEMVSANLSETISRLNEANRTIHGLRQIVNGSAISSAEKNAELSRVKLEIIAISKVKADTTLKAENQRLRAELELLKRNKFKRGRK